MNPIIKFIALIIIIIISVSLTAQKEIKNLSNTSEEDKWRALEVHNSARIDVDVPLLKWSVKLANDAQVYANYLAKRNMGLIHSRHIDEQGENLYMCYTTNTKESFFIPEFPCRDASSSWYNEIEDYNHPYTQTFLFLFKRTIFPINSSSAVGHYTQMVWSSTSKLGIAWAVSSTGRVYVVARYSKPGNCRGEYPYSY